MAHLLYTERQQFHRKTEGSLSRNLKMTTLAKQAVLSLSPVGGLPEESGGSGAVEINLPLYKLLRPRTENECQLNGIHIPMQVC